MNCYSEVVFADHGNNNEQQKLSGNLETAITLNAKHPGFSLLPYDGSLNDLFNNENKLFIHSTQGSKNTPSPGIISMCITFAVTPKWGFQYYYDSGGIYYRTNQDSVISNWAKISK